MAKFGRIESVYMPASSIALVRFINKSDSDRAVEEGEVIIEPSVVSVERAFRSAGTERRDRGGDRDRNRDQQHRGGDRDNYIRR